MFQRTVWVAAAVAAVTVGFVACDDPAATGPENQPTSDGLAHLQVLLTDAPADYIAGAWVDIGVVEILPSGAGGPINLTDDGTAGMVNLLDFQGPATTPIAEATIEPGEYKQLRLIVDSARVDLMPGYTFRDGSTSMSLKVPSGAQTGIKLNLRDADGAGGGDGVLIHPGQTVLLLDFDVNQSFRIQGNPETPAGIKSMLFTPLIRVSVQDVAGSISGTVTPEADSINVEGLMVTADPTGTGTVPGYQTMMASAMTDADGNYTLHYLVPGEYGVTVAVPDGFITDPELATVNVGYDEDVMGVDFEVQDALGSIAGQVTPTSDTMTVEGLTVTAEDTAAARSTTATTDADGNYAMMGVFPGDYAVTVDVPEGFATVPDTADVPLAPKEEVTGVDFELVDPGSISGTVTPAADSIDVEALEVWAENTGTGDLAMGTTASDGTYTIEFVLPGDYTVTVDVPDGFATDPESAAVTVGGNEHVQDVDFEVDEESDGG